MNHGEIKTEHHLGPTDLARLLRELADQAAADPSAGQADAASRSDTPILGDFPMAFDRLVKLELKLKRQEAGWTAKLKIKQTETLADAHNEADQSGEEEAPREEAPRKEKYKRLKKRMDTDFKVIRKAVHENRLPPAEVAHRFLEDSTTMVTYPGFGDCFYEDYTLACKRLRDSFTRGDLEAVRDALGRLREQEKRCHDAFK